MKKFHLVKIKDGWELKEEKVKSSLRIFKCTKIEAVKNSAEYLRKKKAEGSLIIHKVNGRFQEERTYPSSRDPKDSVG